MSPAATSSAVSSGPVEAKVGLGVLLVPVLLSTVLTLAAVGGGIFWLLRSGRLPSSAPTAAASPAAPLASHVVALDPMIVNLADGRSYLRAGVSLRLGEDGKDEKKEEAAKDTKAVDGAMAALRDTTLTVLSSWTADGLLAPGGRESLKKALQAAYKERNEESHVMEVYFTEFLVQRG